jgi:hypothetical protein
LVLIAKCTERLILMGNTDDMRGSVKKEWRQPSLRKLSIKATDGTRPGGDEAGGKTGDSRSTS